MKPAETKSNRLMAIEALLLAHPEGLIQSDIANRLNVNRSTVSRYLPDLPGHFYIEEDGRWKVDRSAYLVNVRFNLHEALAVHLAARLLATRMERQNPHAAAALRKLGVALEMLAPCISRHRCCQPTRWMIPVSARTRTISAPWKSSPWRGPTSAR